jgi:hypothetical protein
VSVELPVEVVVVAVAVAVAPGVGVAAGPAKNIVVSICVIGVIAGLMPLSGNA